MDLCLPTLSQRNASLSSVPVGQAGIAQGRNPTTGQ